MTSAVLVLLLVGVSGCAAIYPPVTAGDPGDAAFKARMAERFPPGTPVAALRTKLAAEGFLLLDDPVARRHSALFRTGNLPCYSFVRVDWTEDRRGRIAELQVQRHDCT